VKCNPILIRSQADPGVFLERIESQPHDPKDEEWLQEVLYRHPELLPVGEFDELYDPPIPVGREVETPSGPLDNLYVSPHSHRDKALEESRETQDGCCPSYRLRKGAQ
jgi:hypothetical protein